VVKDAILSEFELDKLNLGSFDTGYGVKEFTMITEPQLYFVLMRSDKSKGHASNKKLNISKGFKGG
jgi:putative antirepressor, BRO family